MTWGCLALRRYHRVVVTCSDACFPCSIRHRTVTDVPLLPIPARVVARKGRCFSQHMYVLSRRTCKVPVRLFTVDIRFWRRFSTISRSPKPSPWHVWGMSCQLSTDLPSSLNNPTIEAHDATTRGQPIWLHHFWSSSQSPTTGSELLPNTTWPLCIEQTYRLHHETSCLLELLSQISCTQVDLDPLSFRFPLQVQTSV
jgi:hypothetical protein